MVQRRGRNRKRSFLIKVVVLRIGKFWGMHRLNYRVCNMPISMINKE